MPSPQALEIARLKAETRVIQKKRYRGLIGIGLGACGAAFALAGMPDILTYAMWGLAALSWFILKNV